MPVGVLLLMLFAAPHPVVLARFHPIFFAFVCLCEECFKGLPIFPGGTILPFIDSASNSLLHLNKKRNQVDCSLRAD